jgi:hypothetical protein
MTQAAIRFTIRRDRRRFLWKVSTVAQSRVCVVLLQAVLDSAQYTDHPGAG